MTHRSSRTAELDVIKRASRLLEKTLVVHTEVEFIPMYRNQPLFGEIDIALRSHNFLIHKFSKVMGQMMRSLSSNNLAFAAAFSNYFASSLWFL